MDLDLMFPSIVSLPTASWEKWMKLFTNLLALVLAYSVFILTADTHIPLRISFVLRERYFSYTSLLHHCAHFISLSFHHTFLIKLTSVSSLHHNYITCSELITSAKSLTCCTIVIILHHFPIPSVYQVTIHIQIPSGTQISYSGSTFVSSFHKSIPIAISHNIWDTWYESGILHQMLFKN